MGVTMHLDVTLERTYNRRRPDQARRAFEVFLKAGNNTDQNVHSEVVNEPSTEPADDGKLLCRGQIRLVKELARTTETGQRSLDYVFGVVRRRAKTKGWTATKGEPVVENLPTVAPAVARPPFVVPELTADVLQTF